MNYTIEKRNFYTLLEKVLNYNYDEEFSFIEKEKDIVRDIIGTKHIYYITNDKNERLFQNESYEIFKEKVFSEYADRTYKKNDKIIISEKAGEMEKILSPYVFNYPILEILPTAIKVFLEEKEMTEKYEFNENEMTFIAMILDKYNSDKKIVKNRSLNTLKKNIKK